MPQIRKITSDRKTIQRNRKISDIKVNWSENNETSLGLELNTIIQP